MAQSFTTSTGQTVFVPGAYPTIAVQPSASNLAVNEVITIMGEADGGPDYTLEPDITLNSFAPSQYSAVLAKYQGGRVVDAFKNAIAASNDPNIQGSPSLIYIVKTNPSTKALYTITNQGFGVYGDLADKSYGQNGNSIFGTITASTLESPASTGSFAYVPSETAAATFQVRVNGGAVEALAISANTSPTTLVGTITSSATGLNSLAGILATGGINRAIQSSLNTLNTLAMTVSGTVATITLAQGSGPSTPAWAVTPTAGDTLNIPSTSILAGAANANVGWYIVTSASSTVIVATAVSTTGTIVAVSATAVGGTDNLDDYSPVTIANATGQSRTSFSGMTSPTLAGVASGSQLIVTVGGGTNVWTAQPQPNDYFFISSSAPSAIATAAGGWYIVNSATTTTATLTRLSNGNPSSFSATSVTAGSPGITVLRPSISGEGKTLEIQDGGGAVSIATEFLTLSATAVTFISSAANPVVLTSTAEQAVSVNLNRPPTSSVETETAGGTVVLLMGYQGTTATVTLANTNNTLTLTTSVTGGVGTNLNINPVTLKLTTISTLAAFISSQPGYTCVPASALVGQLPIWSLNSSNGLYAWTLDQGTFGICSTTTATPGRIKDDAYAFFNAITNQSQLSILVQPSNTSIQTQPVSGLPDPVMSTQSAATTFFFAGGTRGGTTNTIVTNALAAIQNIRTNFVVPLFSVNASIDASLGYTDPTSSYTIASINAAALAHVIFMSTVSMRGNRQAFLSNRDIFLNDQKAAQNIASYRCSMCFQDVKALNYQGNLTQFQPWMTAVLAAGMQAAGFYKAIVNKQVNISGVLQGAVTPADFSDQNLGNLTTALQSGLLPIRRTVSGSFNWVSDQTTYGVDNNFVYNSIQAVYAADTVALTVAQQMEAAFVGQSLADVSAAVAVSFIQSVMANLKRIKLITSSSDAPAGYKNLIITIAGPVMQVSMEIKLATAIYFIPINFLVSQVTQSAAG